MLMQLLPCVDAAVDITPAATQYAKLRLYMYMHVSAWPRGRSATALLALSVRRAAQAAAVTKSTGISGTAGSLTRVYAFSSRLRALSISLQHSAVAGAAASYTSMCPGKAGCRCNFSSLYVHT